MCKHDSGDARHGCSDVGPVDPRPRLERALREHRLSPRQVEVLGLLADGLANKEIAAHLGCAENTVETHVTALLRKWNTDSRTRLIARFWST